MGRGTAKRWRGKAAGDALAAFPLHHSLKKRTVPLPMFHGEE